MTWMCLYNYHISDLEPQAHCQFMCVFSKQLQLSQKDSFFVVSVLFLLLLKINNLDW